MNQSPRSPADLSEMIRRYSDELMRAHRQAPPFDPPASAASAPPAETARTSTSAVTTPEPAVERRSPLPPPAPLPVMECEANAPRYPVDPEAVSAVFAPSADPPAPPPAAYLYENPSVSEDGLSTPPPLAPEEPTAPLGPEAGQPEIPAPQTPDVDTNPLAERQPPAPPSEETAHLQVRVTTARQAVPIEGARVVVTRLEDGQEKLMYVLNTNSDGITETVALPAVPARYSLIPGYENPFTLYNVDVSHPGYFNVRIRGIPLYGGVTATQPVDLTPLPENVTPGPSNDELIFESAPQNL